MGDIRNFLQHQSPQFNAGRLLRNNLSADPIEQFKIWFSDVLSADIIEANAMNLATVNDKGQPSSRIVLLKGVDENGFVFFTNYGSRKAKEIAHNPNAALNFFWASLSRQVRVEGTLSKVSEKASDEYFKSRPRLSQLGAIASAQSEIIGSNEVLEERITDLEKEYLNKEISRPKHWGGYILVPHRIEFWIGRPNRLHDRFQYTLEKDKSWLIERLFP